MAEQIRTEKKLADAPSEEKMETPETLSDKEKVALADRWVAELKRSPLPSVIMEKMREVDAADTRAARAKLAQ
ncbi:MAG: hypothetical protein G01um101418_658 [Parcubacteria group bacterium Gr01-1014_18]|nr:MAG: hypothetical protein Greene041636_631 [Parcubacteria group bacterium Greene0416_36]TSC80739.1 MAG: hypothetical protein G01um101418_658 [Parcubacteria group bacterium Gr01-1014_18]TSC98650.1 MAG: hypothetical protein Greene101420_609 [Parcubacteria group bacterium Greene1014_20]TSD07190.1 MAG: hypothetical protein Greene07142_359 [Parcubacteria group bacterium Greene0714_2]